MVFSGYSDLIFIMPTTDIEGPNSHEDIGTDIGDGVNYASISSTQRNRVLETSTGANAMGATATPSGVLFKCFFNAFYIQFLIYFYFKVS